MPHYFVIDARFSLSTDPDSPYTNYNPPRYCETSYTCTKPRRPKHPRARSGSISVTSLDKFPNSPVNRFAQSMGPERTKPTKEDAWSRHTTPAMSTRRMDFFCDYNFAESWDESYRAKSNRRSVWQRFTENVDKCVFRVVSKFYK
ncbi:Myb protein J [Phytophthora cinnamomi]|uniref:Myb protein J n=1 Tax=Phytophthora cinnamomi TaxID=4785 RepID=UPI00355996F9|nr:Myb protein J [Phytophthora cinnamomi]